MTHMQTVAVDQGRPSFQTTNVRQKRSLPRGAFAQAEVASRKPRTRAQCLDAVGNRPGFGHDRFALWRELWLAGRPAIEQRKTELRPQGVENVREAIRPEAGQGPIRRPAD